MMKNYAVVLSGGKGLRLGGDIPKQYIEIAGKPVLAYSLVALQNSDVDEIVIVAAEEYMDTCRKIAADNGIDKLVGVVCGGKERYDSVWNGLKFFFEKDGNQCEGESFSNCLKNPADVCPSVPRNSSDISKVLIHDGARPFIKPEIINTILGEIDELTGAIAAAPCTDTIKIADESGFITSTTDRKFTWSAQTPQGFEFTSIYNAYKKVIGSMRGEKSVGEPNDSDISNCEISKTTITDDAMVYQLIYPACKVKLVMAGHDNIKITTPKDIAVAESIIGSASLHQKILSSLKV